MNLNNVYMTNIIEYNLNKPFPHCIIENFLDIKHANNLYNYILSLNLNDANSKFTNQKSLYEYNKFAFSKIDNFPLPIQDIFKYLNSKEFIEQIEKVTEINDLIYGDCNLNGAGIHIIKNKGRLAMHTDFNTYDHPKLGKLDRRINLLVYMNKDWNSNYKGDLLMYNPNNKLEVKSIQPIFNRCVIFNTTNKSVHGHPESLDVPNEDICRKSIAIYYYTKNKNKEVDFEGDHAHSTIWHEIPNNL